MTVSESVEVNGHLMDTGLLARVQQRLRTNFDSLLIYKSCDNGRTFIVRALRGLDRVSATRLSFLLGIPALLAAGAYELKDATTSGPGAPGTGATIVATVVAFVVAYGAIAFLLRFVAHHSIAAFVPYRVLLGVAVLVGVALT